MRFILILTLFLTGCADVGEALFEATASQPAEEIVADLVAPGSGLLEVALPGGPWAAVSNRAPDGSDVWASSKPGSTKQVAVTTWGSDGLLGGTGEGFRLGAEVDNVGRAHRYVLAVLSFDAGHQQEVREGLGGWFERQVGPAQCTGRTCTYSGNGRYVHVEVSSDETANGIAITIEAG